MMRLPALLALLSLADAQEQPAGPPVLSSTALPVQVMPHCLYGLDPHAAAVEAWPNGPEPRGYRVEPGSPLHLLRWLGLLEGDVITAVNGEPLGTAERHYAARQATHAATTCRWSVLRGDQPGVVEATLSPGEPQALVLERDEAGMPSRLSRAALLQRLSDPYAFGPYASMLAMAADDGVYFVDKGLVALASELGFQPLDHHVELGGITTASGRTTMEALTHLLTDPSVTWRFRRAGELQTLELVIEGDPVPLPGG